MGSSRSILLLTATVLPATQVVRADPQIRLMDYMQALEQWWSVIRDLPIDVVFVENSGYKIGAIHELIQRLGATSRIHVDQYIGDAERMVRLGKGAGELDIIDRYLSQAQYQEHDCLIKCTGRLFVKNAPSLIQASLAGNTDFSIALRSDLAFADTRFFIIRRRVASKYLSGLGDEVRDDEGVNMEHLVARQLLQLVRDGGHWRRFASLPRYVGVGGTYGRRHLGPSGYLRYGLKAVLHATARRFGQHLFL